METLARSTGSIPRVRLSDTGTDEQIWPSRAWGHPPRRLDSSPATSIIQRNRPASNGYLQFRLGSSSPDDLACEPGHEKNECSDNGVADDSHYSDRPLDPQSELNGVIEVREWIALGHRYAWETRRAAPTPPVPRRSYSRANRRSPDSPGTVSPSRRTPPRPAASQTAACSSERRGAEFRRFGRLNG